MSVIGGNFQTKAKESNGLIRQLVFASPTIFSSANTEHIEFNELVWLPAA